MSLCQHFTPLWMAEALVERHFWNLTADDLVLEPCCGPGSFLRAIPAHVPAIGIEIDRELALRAAGSGRQVLTGDVLDPVFAGLASVTAVIGNPPFRGRFIDQLLERCHAWLPEGGRAGFILPAYVFRTADRVVDLLDRWSVAQELLPRSAFSHRMREPLVFAMFTKDRRRKLVGFALFAEESDRQAIARQYREILRQTEGSAWRAVCTLALKRLGGEADLAAIYAELYRNRPSRTEWWKEKIRQTLRHYRDCFRPVREGRYALVSA